MQILFLDDNHYDCNKEIECLRAFGHEVTVAGGFLEAMDALRSSTGLFQGALIDVVIPPGRLPDELMQYVPSIATHLKNTGQLLGLWLQHNRKEMRFAYMSIVEHEVDRLLHAGHDGFRGVIDRNRAEAWGPEFAKTVNSMFVSPEPNK